MELLTGSSLEAHGIPEKNKSASAASSGASILTANGANRFAGDSEVVDFGGQPSNNMGLNDSMADS